MKNVYALLNPVAGIQSLVGLGTSPQSSRIYPGVAPEDTALPYIEVHSVIDQPINTLAGVDDMHRERIQLSCYAATFDGAQALADAAHDALEGNGYQESRVASYGEKTKTHAVFLDWSFLI